MKLLKLFKKRNKYILEKEYIVNLEDIKISEEFKHSPPRPDKIRDKYSNYYYNKHMDRIKIDVNGILLDGYCTYLLGKIFSIKEVKVLVIE